LLPAAVVAVEQGRMLIQPAVVAQVASEQAHLVFLLELKP
jgi:hypothetical protein